MSGIVYTQTKPYYLKSMVCIKCTGISVTEPIVETETAICFKCTFLVPVILICLHGNFFDSIFEIIDPRAARQRPTVDLSVTSTFMLDFLKSGLSSVSRLSHTAAAPLAQTACVWFCLPLIKRDPDEEMLRLMILLSSDFSSLKNLLLCVSYPP